MSYDGVVTLPSVIYCPWHQSYEPWYAHPYGYAFTYPLEAWSHVDIQHSPYVGGHWHGMHIYENCKWCAQPLVATADPSTNYCPSCESYQWHRL